MEQVKKVKDSWNREEVIKFAKDILYAQHSYITVYTYPDGTIQSIDEEDFNRYIKENL